MFSGKKKLPMGKVFREGNSRNRFMNELAKEEDKLFMSFDSTQSSKSKKVPLKQTQICVRHSLKRPHDALNETFTTAEKLETKTELFLIPMPKVRALNDGGKVKFNTTVCGGEDLEKPTVSSKVGHKPTENNSEVIKHESDMLADPQHNTRVFVGNVGFVTKTAKLYPNINALWDVYGKVIKRHKGKNRFEQVLLIRNVDDTGPILQCTYFDFNQSLENLEIGSNVRVVGKIYNVNILRTFKIEAYDQTISQSNFMRIQNVNTFVLLQNNNTEEC